MNQENFCSLMIDQFIWRVIPIFTGEQLGPIERGWGDTNAKVEPCLNPDSNKTTVRRHFWDSGENLNMDWASTNIKELQMIIFRVHGQLVLCFVLLSPYPLAIAALFTGEIKECLGFALK